MTRGRAPAVLSARTSETRIIQYTHGVMFRDRLLATLRAVEPILDVPGVLVAGSEVPNLLEANAAVRRLEARWRWRNV